MNKIVSLSKYGFKLDSLRNDWEKVDKSLLNRDIFKGLEKGMNVEIIGRNKEGFVTDLKIIKSLTTDLGEDVKVLDKHKRDILKGQCLNIVFNSLIGQDLGFDKNRETGIRIAQRLFTELEAADYYNW